MIVTEVPKTQVYTEARRIRDGWSETERNRRRKLGEVRRVMLLQMLASGKKQKVA